MSVAKQHAAEPGPLSIFIDPDHPTAGNMLAAVLGWPFDPEARARALVTMTAHAMDVLEQFPRSPIQKRIPFCGGM
ncbi:hypothetical protein [Pseudoroseomonas sp. WGS1072]|uniref:hypothetical protein n=1 Tax=Roseomonas sp. WGS1072 TaxID=3366816 RepID=UPI003BF393FD